MRRLLIEMITLYRIAVSPFIRHLSALFSVSMSCRYALSCSEFAEMELTSNPSLLRAVRNICLRVLSCSPFENFLRGRHGH